MNEFTYLRGPEALPAEEDIHARMGKARLAFAMLRPIWRAEVRKIKTMLRVFGSNVKAVRMLWFVSETWRMTKGLEQKFQVFNTARGISCGFWPLKNQQQGPLETNREASDRAREDKDLGVGSATR